ncbi:MAG: hypothetical protein H6744_06855 [Deltaproteobacteria bacterium]|nr:hypothetical protein [Deltaproteobacteria bacterium]MCB9786399.1 hypothetical protein [Deltaproteobacteria bacterium]
MLPLHSLALLALLAVPQAPRPAEPPARPEAAPRPAAGLVDAAGNRVSRRATAGPRSSRRARQSIERTPPPTEAELQAREQLLELPVLTSGCSIRRQPHLVERLLSLTNTSQALSLEIWGDLRAYHDRQKVIFYMRAPMRMYVTLFWIGPGGEIFVPFDSLAIPDNRNVSADPDAVIVPPLGHERWVAIATLEPVRLPCGAGEAEMLATVERAVALPHAIGRWEVWSGDPAAQGGAGR